MPRGRKRATSTVSSISGKTTERRRVTFSPTALGDDEERDGGQQPEAEKGGEDAATRCTECDDDTEPGDHEHRRELDAAERVAAARREQPQRGQLDARGE